MGQYYCWVNVDRKEYMWPCDFHEGGKLFDLLTPNSESLRALFELLSDDWKGCRIVYLGDECYGPDFISNEVLDILLKQQADGGYSGSLFDTVLETYRSVSCQFKAVEQFVRQEIGRYLDALNSDGYIPPNVYGIDVSDPYNGLFLREGKSFRYILNRDTKIGYSPESVRVISYDDGESYRFDPLSLLMVYGGERFDAGDWLGDNIEVSDTLPEGYTLFNEIMINW